MATRTKIALIIEYDGTRYHGFQWQANALTVQATLEAAIAKLTGETLRVISASRTDAGVHASGQVISFWSESGLPLPAFVHGLNHYLPEDIAVKEAFKSSDNLDIRKQAVSREYSYTILNRPTRSPLRRAYAWVVPTRLDVEAMNEACQALIGEHDMASFATKMDIGSRNTVKTLCRASVARNGDQVVFEIVANSFLPHQVRNTIGSLVRVGTGAMSASEFRQVIGSRQPGLAGPTAPARGLCLVRVNYPGPLGEDNEKNWNQDLQP